jgi:LPS O-antigen subunit length determinant protein (WzzB/FepE family)
LERNQNANSARLRFERERLQRQVSFKEQLYSELQGQRSQTRLELQRQQPVVTVVEKPVVPPQPSAPDRTLIFVLFVGLGLVLSVLWIIGEALINSTGTDPESNRKVQEIIDKVPTATTLKNRVLKARGETANDE